MSKIKSRYFDFINSSDYEDYYLNYDEQTRSELRKRALERFSELGQYPSRQKVEKQFVERFNEDVKF